MPRTPQPLHIFRKDLTHLWPETLIVILLYAAIAWAAPSRWAGSDNQYAVLIGLLGGLLKLFLMPIAWLVLIARLVHDEPLVGDRQFWTSRPYNWYSLFAAKVLYLIAFLYVPFLLMQIYLLKHAGLYPTTAISGLLHNLLLLTVLIVIPFAAIAAVTSTMMRALLSFVGAIIYLLVLGGFVVWAVIRRMPPPQLEPIVIWLFILFPLAALLVQYATRRTVIARSILLGTPLLITILFFLLPADLLVHAAYPLASTPKLGQLPAELAPKAPGSGPLAVRLGYAVLGIPLTISDAAKDTSYLIDGISASVEAGDTKWSTPFTIAQTRPFSSDSPGTIVPVSMPLDTFNRIGHIPADLHLSFAVEISKQEKPSTWKATKQPFSVPGHGVCSFPTDSSEEPPTCRFPFKSPDIEYISANVSLDCSSVVAPHGTAYASFNPSATFLDFDPVVVEPLRFSVQGAPQGTNLQLCPGTDLTIVEQQRQDKERLDLDLKQLVLENYALHNDQQHPRGPRPQPGDQQ
jgi:hypothetical protein